jgi:hypothetical protein
MGSQRLLLKKTARKPPSLIFHSASMPKAGGTFTRGNSQVIHDKMFPFMGLFSTVKKVIHQIEGYPQSLWITLCITYDLKDGMTFLLFPPLSWGKNRKKAASLFRTGLPFGNPYKSSTMWGGMLHSTKTPVLTQRRVNTCGQSFQLSRARKVRSSK